MVAIAVIAVGLGFLRWLKGAVPELFSMIFSPAGLALGILFGSGPVLALLGYLADEHSIRRQQNQRTRKP